MSGQPGIRILLVDDDADTCEAFRALFGVLGHEAFAARQGADALKLASTGRWDLALVDLNLPDMDGYEVARHLKSMHGPAMMLVAVTGYQGQGIRASAIDAGFDHFFVKPLEWDVLEALVNAASVVEGLA